MPIRIIPARRKRGKRAGLTMAKILEHAINMLEQGGIERFSLRRLAKELSVKPRAIQARFDGGATSFWRALAQFALADVARPFTPLDSAESYMRDLFRTAHKTFRKNPALARIVAREMAGNYALLPPLTERILVALHAGCLGKNQRIAALDLVFGVFAGLLLIETGTATIHKEHSDTLKQMSGLSTTEFPQLTTCANNLADRIAKRPQHDETVADRYADLVLVRLKLASSQKPHLGKKRISTIKSFRENSFI